MHPQIETSRYDRLSFASGIASAALFLAGAAVFITQIGPELPALDAPFAERAAFYARMARSDLYRSLSYLGELQMLLLLPFFGGLFGVLRRAEGGSGALSMAVFGAGVALAVMTPLIILIEDHLMLGFAREGVDPVIVASIDGLGPLSFALGGFPQAIVLIGTALLLPRAGIIPRWLGWFGIAVAVLSLLATATPLRGMLFPLAAGSMMLFRVWMLSLGIVLFRRATARASAVARDSLRDVLVDARPLVAVGQHPQAR